VHGYPSTPFFKAGPEGVFPLFLLQGRSESFALRKVTQLENRDDDDDLRFLKLNPLSKTKAMSQRKVDPKSND
jgi:hypothetical protein